MEILLWFLLPVAAASGWWMAQYSHNKHKAGARARLNSAYGQGLNHLLNEESDKATEVLIQMVEVDPDTVELHLALGSLFRRRGEVDRAIRVHRNISARSKLSDALRSQAELELGRDFLRAGLLDRAERIFRKLLDRSEYEKEVCQHLVELYQQEKEWGKAIEVGERLVDLDSALWKQRLAQYHCETGEAALGKKEFDRALDEAGLAQREDPDCVRATLIRGHVLQARGDYGEAITTYQRVEVQNADLLPEVMGDIQACYIQLGDAKGWELYLDALVARHSYLVFFQKHLVHRQTQDPVVQQARYRCEKCGFTSRKLFWQCPGCQGWSSVKPIKASGSE
ncbi:MAG: lipopolysaccharide assembly protein LapB [Thiogranum sp.]